jgi:transposase-like protein
MVVMISDECLSVWRAVDDEGEALDVLAEYRRNRAAALKLLRRLPKTQGLAPTRATTYRLRSIPRCRHASATLPSSLASSSTLRRCCATVLAASRGAAFFAVDDRPIGSSSFPKIARKEG